MRDHFWTRWAREYLHSLQQRAKWQRPRNNLVVIIDPSLIQANGRWPIGRVLRICPGSDDRMRVAEIRTAGGTYTRPISKLVRLPLSATADSPSS